MPGKQNNKQQQPNQQKKGAKKNNQQPQKQTRKQAVKKPQKRYGALKSVAAIQALPMDHAAFRIPCLTPQRTSVLKFVDERPMAVTATASSFAMVTRSPTRQLWLSKTVSSTLAASSYYTRTYVSANKNMVPNNKGESLSLIPMFQLESATATSWNLTVNGTDFLPNYPLAVDSTNGVWFYYPSGGSAFLVELDTTVNLSGGPLTWTFETCQNFSSSNIKTFTVQGGTTGDIMGAAVTAAVLPDVHGFIRPVLITCTGDIVGDGLIEAIRIGVATNGTLTVPQSAATGTAYTPTAFFAPPPDTESIKTAVAPYSDSRVAAVSVLFMNETREFGKEGHVNGLRVNLRTASSIFSPTMYTTYDTLYANTAEKDKYGGKLQEGLYMFCRPDEASLQFRDWTSYGASATAGSVIRLDAFDFVDIIRFTDRNSAEDTNLTAVTTYHLEWLNTTPLWPSGVQRMPYESWRQAIATLSEINHYTENPIHLRDIMRRVGQALRWAAPIVAPYAKQAAFALARTALL